MNDIQQVKLNNQTHFSLALQNRLVKLLGIPKANRSIQQNINIRDILIEINHPLQKIYKFRPEGLLKICQESSLETHDEHKIIYQQVDKGDKFYIILDGSVGIYFPKDPSQRYEDVRSDFQDDIYKYTVEEYKKRLNLIHKLEKDSWFGEIGLINHGLQHSIAISETTVQLMTLGVKEYLIYFYEREQNILYKKLTIFKSNMFSQCSDSYRRILFYLSRKVTYSQKEVAIAENKPIEEVLIIKKGEFGIYKRIYDEDTMEQIDASSKINEIENKLRIKPKEANKYSKTTKLKVISKNEVVGEIDTLARRNSSYTCICDSYDGGIAIAIPKLVFLYVVSLDKELQNVLGISLREKTKDFNERVHKISSQMQRFGDFFFFKGRGKQEEIQTKSERMFKIDERTKQIKQVIKVSDKSMMKSASEQKALEQEELKLLIDTIKEAESQARETEIKDDMNYFPLKKSMVNSALIESTMLISSKDINPVFTKHLRESQMKEHKQKDNQYKSSPLRFQNMNDEKQNDQSCYSPRLTQEITISHSSPNQTIQLQRHYIEDIKSNTSSSNQIRNIKDKYSVGLKVRVDEGRGEDDKQQDGQHYEKKGYSPKKVQNDEDNQEKMEKGEKQQQVKRKRDKIFQRESSVEDDLLIREFNSRIGEKELQSSNERISQPKISISKSQGNNMLYSKLSGGDRSPSEEKVSSPRLNQNGRIDHSGIFGWHSPNEKNNLGMSLLNFNTNGSGDKADGKKIGKITDRLLQKMVVDSENVKKQVMKDKETFSVGDLQSQDPFKLKSLFEVQNYQKKLNEKHDPTKYDQKIKFMSTKVLDLNIQIRGQKNKLALEEERIKKEKEFNNINDQQKEQIIRSHLNRLGFNSPNSSFNSTHYISENKSPMGSQVLIKGSGIGQEAPDNSKLTNFLIEVNKQNIQTKKKVLSRFTSENQIRKSMMSSETQTAKNSLSKESRPYNLAQTSGERYKSNPSLRSKSLRVKEGNQFGFQTIKESSFFNKEKEKEQEQAEGVHRILDGGCKSLQSMPQLDSVPEIIPIPNLELFYKKEIDEESLLTSQKGYQSIFHTETRNSFSLMGNQDNPHRKSVFNYNEFTLTQQSNNTPVNQHSVNCTQKESPSNSIHQINEFPQAQNIRENTQQDSSFRQGDNLVGNHKSPKKTHFKSSVDEYLEMKAMALANNYDKKKIRTSDIPFLDSYAHQLQINLKRLFYVKLKDKYGKENGINLQNMQERIADQVIDQNTKIFLQNNKNILPDKITHSNYLYNWRKSSNSPLRGGNNTLRVQDYIQNQINQQGYSTRKPKLPQLYENHNKQSIESQINNSSSNIAHNTFLSKNSPQSVLTTNTYGGREQILNERAKQFSMNMQNIQQKRNLRRSSLVTPTLNQLFDIKLALSPQRNPIQNLGSKIQDINLDDKQQPIVAHEKLIIRQNQSFNNQTLSHLQSPQKMESNKSAKAEVQGWTVREDLMQDESEEGIMNTISNGQQQYQDNFIPISPNQKSNLLQKRENQFSTSSVEQEMVELTNSIISKYGLKTKFKKKELKN